MAGNRNERTIPTSGNMSQKRARPSNPSGTSQGTKARSMPSKTPQGTRDASQGTKSSKNPQGTREIPSETSQGTRGLPQSKSFPSGVQQDSDSSEGETLCPNTPAPGMVGDEEIDSAEEVEQQDQEENPSAPNKKKPGVRGRTKCIWLADIGINERQPIEFNGLGKVCSLNATVFANWCGYVVRKRTNAPLNVTDWSEIPDKPAYKDKTFAAVCEKFIIPEDEYHKEIVMNILKEKYRSYRTSLKRKYFDTCDTYAKKLANLPPDVVKDDWIYLLALFNDEKYQAMCERNKENRSKQVMCHKAGTSSFAKIERQEIDKNGGQHPGNYHLFKKVHIDKKGQPSDPKSKSIMDQVENEAAQKEAENAPVDKDAIYVKVRLPEKRRNRVPKVALNFQSEQLRIAREEAAIARAETHEVRMLAEASARRAEESDRKFAEMLADMANFQKQMAQMKRMMEASGVSMYDDSETQDPNA